MEKGEFIIFCKDFNFKLPKSKILDVFRKASKGSIRLDIDEFKNALSLLTSEYTRAKQKEVKNRLMEIKNVIEFPKVKVSEPIEKLINGKIEMLITKDLE